MEFKPSVNKEFTKSLDRSYGIGTDIFATGPSIMSFADNYEMKL